MFLLRRRCTITWPRGRSLRVLESRLGREDSSPCSTQRSILENSSNNYPQRTARIGRRRIRAYRIPQTGTLASREKNSYPPFSRGLPPAEADLGESFDLRLGIGWSTVFPELKSSLWPFVKTS